MTEANQVLNSPAPTTKVKATPPRIAIIGAGLTGLMTATLLERKFAELGQALTIDIFEKSAGVGRLATRYKSPNPKQDRHYQFEFGAQFFTAKSREFQQFLAPWIESGTVTPWHAKVATLNMPLNDNANVNDAGNISVTEQWGDEQPRYISSPKMTSWGRALAKALTQTSIHYKTRVAPLSDSHINSSSEVNSRPQTQLFDTDGNYLGVFNWIICTAPSVQASELLANTSCEFKDEIAQAKMLACYTLMLGWKDPEALPNLIKNNAWDVLEINNPLPKSDLEVTSLSSLDSVFIEHHKPQRDELLPSMTIHASNKWSEQHVDDDIESIKATMLTEAQRILGWGESYAPEHIDCHRWRYAATARGLVSEGLTTQTPSLSQQAAKLPANKLLIDKSKRWIVTGDWCVEGRIESCYQIARLTSHSIVNSL